MTDRNPIHGRLRVWINGRIQEVEKFTHLIIQESAAYERARCLAIVRDLVIQTPDITQADSTIEAVEAWNKALYTVASAIQDGTMLREED